ncbi:MAG: hypothetical protein P4L46_00485 [Fimbriimonas sp.]|nr:hypothetical protein [Fimbriimonas sp.]
MRRTVLILPGLISLPGTDSFMGDRREAMADLARMGDLSKVSPAPASETPETMILGMSPDSVRLRQGPLTVSALGFDPPERSTHFHLSPMSYVDGNILQPDVEWDAEEMRRLMVLAKRLDTKLLTILGGSGFDHALVWEALGDLGTTSPTDVNGKSYRDHLPQGDGETVLKRLIDDSVNLLGELDINKRRVEDGLPPLNVLWPWGQGVRTPVPNLAIRRGEPASVESVSLRLAGLTRLAGYRHVDRAKVGQLLKTQLRSIADRCLSRQLSIIYLDVATDLRTNGMAEELDWFIREVDRELVRPLLSDLPRSSARLTLIAASMEQVNADGPIPASAIGLAAATETGMSGESFYPFDERSTLERSIPTRDLWDLVQAGIEA